MARVILRTVMLTAVCALMSAIALAAEPAAEAKVPPGWAGRKTGEVMCPWCRGQAYPENVGRCQECRKWTASGAFKLCRVHALELKKCCRCLAFFPGDPTPGLRLELGWLKPELKVTDPVMRTNSTESVPLWLTVVNTTKEPIAAPEVVSVSGRLDGCETLVFTVAGAGRLGPFEDVLLNAPRTPKDAKVLAALMRFEPGATTFERDLFKGTPRLAALQPGTYKVRAAVGSLESNELTLVVTTKDGGEPVAPLDPKVAADVAKLMESCKKAMAAGQTEAALEMARRIAAVNPALGKKLLEELESWARTRSKEDTEKAREKDELRRPEDEMRQRQAEEEMKRKAEEEMKKRGQ